MLAVCPKNTLIISLTYKIHHGVLCVVRVYALYGRNRRILGFLLFLSTGWTFASLVGHFSLILRLVHAYLIVFSLSVTDEVSLSFFHNPGDVTIQLQFVSPFGGCAQYTSHIGYVADPACV